MTIHQSSCLYIIAVCFSILFQDCASTEKMIYYDAIPQSSDNQQIVITCAGNFMTSRVFKMDFTFRNNSSESVLIDPSNIFLLNDNSVNIKQFTPEQTTDLILLEFNTLNKNFVHSNFIGRFLETTTVAPKTAIQGLLTWNGSDLVFPLWLGVRIGNDKFMFKVEHQINQGAKTR